MENKLEEKWKKKREREKILWKNIKKNISSTCESRILKIMDGHKAWLFMSNFMNGRQLVNANCYYHHYEKRT